MGQTRQRRRDSIRITRMLLQPLSARLNAKRTQKIALRRRPKHRRMGMMSHTRQSREINMGCQIAITGFMQHINKVMALHGLQRVAKIACAVTVIDQKRKPAL